MSNKEQEISNIIKVRDVLDTIEAPISKTSTEYQQIVNTVQDFLLKNCDHLLVYDYIDITPDRSERICYCSRCFTTFR